MYKYFLIVKLYIRIHLKEHIKSYHLGCKMESSLLSET